MKQLTIRNILKKVQRDKKMTDEQFARELDCSREWWNGVKRGREKVTYRIAVNAANAFPEIREDVFKCL